MRLRSTRLLLLNSIGLFLDRCQLVLNRHLSLLFFRIVQMGICLIYAWPSLLSCLYALLWIFLLMIFLNIAVRVFFQRAEQAYLSFDLWYTSDNLSEFSSSQIVLTLEWLRLSDSELLVLQQSTVSLMVVFFFYIAGAVLLVQSTDSCGYRYWLQEHLPHGRHW